MEQIANSKTPPQRVHATPEEVEKLIGNRLAHHAQYAALFAEAHKNHEQDL